MLKVLRDKNKVLVQGINRVYRHVKRGASAIMQQGGRLSKEMPVGDFQRAAGLHGLCHKATRTGSRIRPDGVKERFCKKCSAAIGVIAPAQKGRGEELTEKAASKTSVRKGVTPAYDSSPCEKP